MDEIDSALTGTAKVAAIKAAQVARFSAGLDFGRGRSVVVMFSSFFIPGFSTVLTTDRLDRQSRKTSKECLKHRYSGRKSTNSTENGTILVRKSSNGVLEQRHSDQFIRQRSLSIGMNAC